MNAVFLTKCYFPQNASIRSKIKLNLRARAEYTSLHRQFTAGPGINLTYSEELLFCGDSKQHPLLWSYRKNDTKHFVLKIIVTQSDNPKSITVSKRR